MKLTIDYTKNTLRIPLSAFRRLKQHHPMHKCIDFTYTTAGEFYIVLSIGSNSLAIDQFKIGSCLQFTSFQFVDAAKKYFTDSSSMSFNIDGDPLFVSENLLYFSLSPELTKYQVHKAAKAKKKLQNFHQYNFPGRIKTNEIKLAELALKAS